MATLGRADVQVGASLAELLADLKKAEAAVKKSAQAMDRNRATIEVDVDSDKAARKLKRLEQSLQELQQRRREMLSANEKADTANIDRRIVQMQRMVLEERKRNSLLKNNLQVEKRVASERTRLHRADVSGLKARERAVVELQRVVDRAHGRALADIREREREEASLARTVSKAHGEALGNIRESRREYEKLKKEVNDLERRGRLSMAFDPAALQRLREAQTELRHTRERVKEVGGSTDDIDVKFRRSGSTISRWANSLANVRVHLGFMSLTIKQLAISSLGFSHVISSATAVLSAFVGVLGSGLIGALGFAGAGLTGFALAAGGITAILVPLIGEFGDARKAITAYDDAVKKYGKGSDQAKTKMEQMNKVLGNTSPKVRKAISDFDGLGDRFKELTSPARGSFFEGVAEAVTTASDLMPMFARRSTQAFRTVSDGLQDWMKGLRSAEGESIIDTIFGNFNAALGPLLKGLGNFQAVLGRIFASFSRHLKPVANVFKGWTEGLLDATSNADSLDGKVDNFMESLKSVGRLLMASTRLIGAFFGAGVAEGQSMTDSITETFNRWTDWINSVEGNASLQEWFAEGRETISNIGSALASLAQVFAQLSNVTRPIFDALITGFTAVSRVIGDIASSGFGAFLAKFAVFAAIGGRVAALAAGFGLFTRMVISMVKALGLFRAALMLAGGPVGIALAGIGALAALLIDFGGASQDAAESQQTLATAMDEANAAIDNQVNAGSTLFDSMQQLKDVQKQLTELENKGKKGTQEYMDLQNQETRLLNQKRESIGNLKSVRQAQIATDKEYETQLQSAFQTMVDSEGINGKVTNSISKNMQMVQADLKRTGTVSQATKAIIAQEANTTEDLDSAVGTLEQSFTGYHAAVLKARKEVAANTFASAQQQRALSGMSTELGRNTIPKIRGLQKIFSKKQILRMTTKFEGNRETQGILKRVEELGKKGKIKQVMEIIAESKNAEQAIKKLDSLAAKVTRKENNVRFKADTGLFNRALDAMDAKAKKPKDVEITTNADKVDADIKALDGITLKDKNMRVNPQADAAIGMYSVISSLPDITIGVNYVGRKSGNHGGGGGGKYAGGIVAAARGGGPDLDRAFRDAKEMRGGRPRKITRPTLLTGEEAPQYNEYVITENPMYKDRNVGFLQQAARSLGLTVVGSAAKGVANKFKIGAVPQDQVENAYQQAQTKYQSAKSKVSTIEGKLKDKDLKTSKKNDLKDDLKEAKRKEKGTRAKMQKRKRELKAVKKVNNKIDLAQSKIDLSTAKISQAQTQSKQGMFERWTEKKDTAIGDILDVLRRASRGASGKFQNELLTRISNLREERTATNTAEFDLGTGPDTLLKGEQERLASIEKDIALAGLTDPLSDDIAKTGKLQDFWEAVLARLQSTGGTDEQITEAATSLKAAKDSLASLKGDTGAGAGIDPNIVVDQFRSDLFRNYGGNFSASAIDPPSLPAGPSAGAAAAAGAASGNQVNVTNNYQEPPPDPHSWSRDLQFELGVI